MSWSSQVTLEPSSSPIVFKAVVYNNTASYNKAKLKLSADSGTAFSILPSDKSKTCSFIDFMKFWMFSALWSKNLTPEKNATVINESEENIYYKCFMGTAPKVYIIDKLR